jgi:hypothetical protein
MKQQAVQFKFIHMLFGLSLLTSGTYSQGVPAKVLIADLGCVLNSLDLSTLQVTQLNSYGYFGITTQETDCFIAPLSDGTAIYVAQGQSLYKWVAVGEDGLDHSYLVAGSGTTGYTYPIVNGPGSTARFGAIRAIKMAPAQTYILIADQFGIRRFWINTETVESIDSTFNMGYDEGSGFQLQVMGTRGLDIDSTGSFAVFYDDSNRVRKLYLKEDPIRSEFIAGSTKGSVDGIQASAQFGPLTTLSISNDGSTVYGLQYLNFIYSIRKIIISTGEAQTITPLSSMDGAKAALLFLDSNSILIPSGLTINILNIQTRSYTVYLGNGVGSATFMRASGLAFAACAGSIVDGYCVISAPTGQYWDGASTQPCPLNSYCTGGTAQPMPCTSCQVGKFAQSSCNHTQNVVCITCPAGFACPDSSSKVTCDRMQTSSDIYPPFASYSTTYFTSATSTVNFYLAGRLGLKETLTYAGAPFGNGVYEIFFSTKDDYYGTAKSVWFDGLPSTYARFRGNTYDSNGVYSGANYLAWEDYTGEWIAVKFLSPRKISGYKLTTNDVTRAFGHFKMYGSTDGAGFQEITQGTTSTKLTAGDYVSVAPDAYQYTRQFEATSTEYLYVGFTVHEVTTNAASIQMSDIFFMTPGPTTSAPPLMGQANYCPAGSTSIALCPAGSFCTNAASIAPCTGYCPVGSPASQACSQCGTGYYATSACTSTTDAVCTACKSCGAGSRVTTACSATSDAVCQACVSGSTYSTTTNAATCQACTPCALGTYSLAACTSTSNAVCTACTICAAGSRVVTACGATSNTVCQPCVSGSTYSTTTNAETCDVCSPCSVGMYTLTACTTSSQTICQHCPAGNYCPNPSFSTVLPCTICDGITKYAAPTCTLTTNSVCQSCTTCTPGNYVASGCNNMEDKVCSACPSGAFSTVLDALSCTPCSQCSAGDTYTSRPCTATSQTECTACITCPANTYTSQPCTSTSQTECTACITCATGYYASTPCTSTSQTVCTPCTTCAATLYVSSQCTSTTNTVCSPCPAGTFNTADSTSPAVCQGSISPSS